MSRRLAEEALLIGLTLFSNDSNVDRQFASIAPGPFDFRGSVVEPPGMATMVFYMAESFAESAL
jgi:hypothetical protein